VIDLSSGLVEWTREGMISVDQLMAELELRRNARQRIITTNGCFDVLHAGHIRFLQDARTLGDVLIVGLNSDESTRRLKGTGRPILPAETRSEMLSALRCVDHVVIFDDLLPNHFLEVVRPDTHCKAGDYRAEDLPEAIVVREHGGEVRILPRHEGLSTTGLIRRITASAAAGDPTLHEGNGEGDLRSFVVELLLNSANVMRQSAYRLSDQVIGSAAVISATMCRGGTVFLCFDPAVVLSAPLSAAELEIECQLEYGSGSLGRTTPVSHARVAMISSRGINQSMLTTSGGSGQSGDVFILISTTPTESLFSAALMAKGRGMRLIALINDETSALQSAADFCLVVPSKDIALVASINIVILSTLFHAAERISALGNIEP
jgi:rfaE bifunctional protein nucleotidyltransferase chain/domain